MKLLRANREDFANTFWAFVASHSGSLKRSSDGKMLPHLSQVGGAGGLLHRQEEHD